jgi:hypothetical protein
MGGRIMRRYLLLYARINWDNSSHSSNKPRQGRWRLLTSRLKIPLLISLFFLFMLHPDAVPVSLAQDGIFIDSGQSMGGSDSRGVALGDLDGDLDLDAFVANDGDPNKVWLNDGSGNFSDSGQSLGSANSQRVALGDLDGDLDLDAFVANYNGANKVWLNDGSGNFSDSGQSLGSSATHGIALGDIDNDGDLDSFAANISASKVWLNDGSGNFSDSGQSLGSSYSWSVVFGDTDGDNDLDAFVANISAANTVWLNDGNGNFTDSGQYLGDSSRKLAVGDLDNDNDLDVFTASDPLSNKVWLNDGSGNFSDSGQSLGSLSNSNSWDAELGDLDGDNDMDVFVANFVLPNKVWLNDGNGNFSDSGQHLGISSMSQGVAIGDLDGDLDLDAFVANRGANKVYLNSDTLPATYDATGEWVFLVSNAWVEQGPGPIICYPQTEGQAAITVTQTGNSVTLVWDGDTFTGYVREASYTGSGTFPMGTGSVTSNIAVSLSSSTSGSGTVYWLWTDGSDACRGGSDLTVTKDGIGGGGGSSGGGGG